MMTVASAMPTEQGFVTLGVLPRLANFHLAAGNLFCAR